VHGVCIGICLTLSVLPGAGLGQCLWFLAVVSVLLQFHGPVPVWPLSLCRLLLSEGRAGLPVSFTERLVSCMLLWGYERFFRPANWVLQHRVGSCSEELLLPRALFRYEGRAGLHVSFPRGLVSCRVWQGHGSVVQVLCRKMWVLLLSLGLLLLPRTKLRSENRVGLHVSIPGGMVSCRLSLVRVRKRWACHRPIWVQCPLPCGMSRSVMGRRPKWWAVLAVDVDRHCAHAPVPQACRDNVPMAAVCLLEGRNLELCCCL